MQIKPDERLQNKITVPQKSMTDDKSLLTAKPKA